MLSLDTIMSAVYANEPIGFCMECDAEHHGIEHDARNCTCEECECDSVYGAEELLIMGVGI